MTPAPDPHDLRGQRARFFEALYADMPGLVELRAVARNGGGVVGRQFLAPTDLSGVEAFAAAHPLDHVYAGVATRRDASSGEVRNCRAVQVLYVDIDFKTTPEPEARRRLAEYPLPPTLVVRSGGGLHCYWLLLDPVEVAAHEAKIRAALLGLAVKLGGDRSAAEPARVLRLPGTVNGKYDPPRVVVLEVCEPHRYHLDDFLQFVPAVEAPAGPPGPFTLSEAILAGDRYTTLFKLARSLKHRGLSPDAVRASLDVENAARCQPPHDAAELDRIVGNAFRSPDRPGFAPRDWAATAEPPPRTDAEAGGTETEVDPEPPTVRVREEPTMGTGDAKRSDAGRGPTAGPGNSTTTDGAPASSSTEAWEAPIPLDEWPVPPFPIRALPAWMAGHARALSRELQVPVDLVAWLDLAQVSILAARTVVVERHPSWREPLNTFIAVVAPSGDGKGPAFDAAFEPLRLWQRVQRAHQLPAVQEYEHTRTLLLARVKAMTKHAADALNPEKRRTAEEAARLAQGELDRLIVKRLMSLFADDVTPEAVARKLSEQQGRLAIVSEEGGVFEIMKGRYSSGQPNLEIYLKGHSGQDFSSDRVTRIGQDLVKPALSIAVAVQPQVIRNLTEEPDFDGKGMIGRFWFAWPVSLLGRRDVDAPPMPGTVRAAYTTAVQALANACKPPRNMSADAPPTPQVIRLSPEAVEVFQAFRRGLEPRLGEDADLAQITGWGGKAAGSCLRLAGLLHLAEHSAAREPWAGAVSGTTIAKAVTLMEYLIPHALVSFARMGLDPRVVRAGRVLRWLARKLQGVPAERRVVSKREVYQDFKHVFGTVGKVTPVVRLLVRQNYLAREASGKRSGRPSERYRVNPLWNLNPPEDPTQNPQNPGTEGGSEDTEGGTPGGSEYAPPGEEEGFEDFEGGTPGGSEYTRPRTGDPLDKKHAYAIPTADPAGTSTYPGEPPQNPQNPFSVRGSGDPGDSLDADHSANDLEPPHEPPPPDDLGRAQDDLGRARMEKAAVSDEDILVPLARQLAPAQSARMLAALRAGLVRLQEAVATRGPGGIPKKTLVETIKGTTLSTEQARALIAAVAGRAFIETNGLCAPVGQSEARLSVGKPFKITRQMEAGLRALRYTSAQIARMTPEETQALLARRQPAPAEEFNWETEA